MIKIHDNQMITAKQIASQVAADLMESGMQIGLGTGSTVAFFIEALSKRCREGLKISIVPSSLQSAKRAQEAGLAVKDPFEVVSLDITVDGADEIDPQKNMIKGGGGALFREKLIAQSSRELIVIVDETKLVESLGKHSLPVEISSFLHLSTIKRLANEGYHGHLRLDHQQRPYKTDNGNYLFDIQYTSPITNPPLEQNRLKSIVGVIETGLFFTLAGRVIIGYNNGTYNILK